MNWTVMLLQTKKHNRKLVRWLSYSLKHWSESRCDVSHCSFIPLLQTHWIFSSLDLLIDEFTWRKKLFSRNIPTCVRCIIIPKELSSRTLMTLAPLKHPFTIDDYYLDDGTACIRGLVYKPITTVICLPCWVMIIQLMDWLCLRQEANGQHHGGIIWSPLPSRVSGGHIDSTQCAI